ncbi:MAG: hypothetical protein OHK0053_37380 [Microscillaceae bacterium]
MWHFRKVIWLFLAGSVGIASTGQIQAQDLGNSPYSQIGIGDVMPPAFSHQFGMAATGASFALPFQINGTNPALLARNRRTILDVGLNSQLKWLREEDKTQRDFGASLGHIGLAFPLAPRLSGSLALVPFSSVSYENVFRNQVINSDFQADLTYKGRGGLTAVNWGMGLDLLGKRTFRPDTLQHRVALGLKINYVFGAVIDEVITTLDQGGNALNYEVALKKRTGYSDFTFEPALHYTWRIDKKHNLNAGLVYALGNELNARRFVSVERRIQDNPIDSDTLIDNQRGNVTLATRWTTGLSLEKLDPRSTLPRWAIALDVAWQNWDDFRDFDNPDTLRNNVVVALGGLYIPDFASVQPGFWRRTIYKVGFRYEQSPFEFLGQSIQDYSMSLGVSVPFGRSSTALNFSLVGGQRGTLSNGGLREQYLRAQFGISINDTWFIKRRYD